MQQSFLQKVFNSCVSNHRNAALALMAIIGAVLLAYYGALLFNVRSYFMSDHCYYFEPFAKWIGKSLTAGRLPLWNPFLYCGMPQSAVPSPGIFYPFAFLFGVVQYSQAVSAVMLFSQIIAALGACLLILSFGWGLTAATIGGIAYSCCGYMFSLSTNYTLVAAAAWVPLMLWSFRRVRLDLEVEQRTPYLAGAAACLSASARNPASLLVVQVLLVSQALRPARTWHIQVNSKITSVLFLRMAGARVACGGAWNTCAAPLRLDGWCRICNKQKPTCGKPGRVGRQ